MNTSNDTRNHNSVLQYVAAYALWAVSLVLSLPVLYWVRETYLISLVTASYQRGELSSSEQFYQSLRARAIDEWSLFLLGIILIIVIVVVENYYRTGVPKGQLLARFSLVTGIQVGVFFLAHTIGTLLESAVSASAWNTAYILVAELVVAVFFFWLYNRQRRTARV